jgi:molybdenum cofactor biosynthesis protein B
MAHSPPRKARVHILTVSDSRTEADDVSGKIMRDVAIAHGHEIVGHSIIPNDSARVSDAIRALTASADAILVNGGTGISPKDRTYESVAALLERRLDGFGELFRMLSFQEIGSKALASRAVAGVIGKTVVFSTPGSQNAVKLAMERLIGPELGHLVGELNK